MTTVLGWYRLTACPTFRFRHQPLKTFQWRNFSGKRCITSGGPDDYVKHGTQVTTGSIVTPKEVNSIANNGQAQSFNCTAHIDVSSTAPVKVDSVNSHCCVEVDDDSPSNLTPLKNIITKCDQKQFIDKDLETESDPGAGSSVCCTGGLQEKAKHVVNLIKTEGEERIRENFTEESPNVIYDLFVEDNLQNNPFEGSAAQCSGVCSENVFVDQAHQVCDISFGGFGKEPASGHDPEVIKQPRGLLRRCLLFDEARKDVSSKIISHSAITTSSSTLSPGSANAERLDFHKGRSSSIRKKQLESPVGQITTSTQFPPCGAGNFVLSASRPLGIGLHLNSVFKAQTVGETATTSVEFSESKQSIQEMKSASINTIHMLDKQKRCSIPSNVVGKDIYAEGGRLDVEASVGCTNATLDSSALGEPQNFLLQMEHQSNKRKFSSEHVECLEDSSPRKKRKNQSGNSDNDSCKRCSCKKSKCLKLYCDCFAAGVYCTEPCACQGCFNRPEYEEKVIEACQQVESRNPFAFAPKIVERIAVKEFQTDNESDNWSMTPSLAKHKKGCNCKKSMCLKKYCECYQANVGCSNNCRCEGCKNVFGTHQGYVFAQELLSSTTVGESSPLELVSNNVVESCSHVEVVNPLELSPLTPSLECSDQGKGPPRSRLLLRHLLSPDSDLVLTSSSKSTSSTCVVLNEDIEAEKKRDFNSLINLCQLNRPASLVSSYSSSNPGVPGGSRSTRIVINGSHICRTSQVEVTPITTSLGIHKDLKPSSGLEEEEDDDDDTPEILKEVASTPTQSMNNVNSPSRKRVSPPHCHHHHHHVHEEQLCSSSSSTMGLKTGRKFILKAVPSLPPLTPCIESKGNRSYIQDDRSSK